MSQAREFVKFMGYRIATCPLAALTEQAVGAAVHRDRQMVFACANPHSLVTAQDDPDFHNALVHTDQLVADGIGLVVVAQLLNIQLKPRITGHQYFAAILNQLSLARPQLNRKGRVFFFGSSQHVLNLISEKFGKTYPDLELCGTLSPPFGNWDEESNQAMLDTINNARPDILWVGMTAPKQEKWVEKNRGKLNAPIIGSIGAVFDFFAETYPRAPEWACRAGLEWVIRLAREPKRMWKRTFISSPRFVAAVARNLVQKGPIS